MTAKGVQHKQAYQEWRYPQQSEIQYLAHTMVRLRKAVHHLIRHRFNTKP